ncbi:MAG: PxKF domain-containing protein, partial [Acidobacteriota bacterium]|nr:PxKF domain-containing protein [Acidobacteriota bacterium]
PNSTWTQVGNAIPSADGVVDYVTVDIDTLVNGARYTYFAVAVFADGVQSDVSNLVTITAVINAAPGLSPIGNQTISADTSAGPLAITVTDESAATVALSGSSSNTTLVPNSGIAFGGSGANRTVTVTPAANQTGTATITITATDASGSVVSTSFLLTVNPAYTFTGFLTPLATAGTDAAPTNSGTLTFGKAVPVKWQLALTGVRVSDLGALASLEAFPGNGAASNTTCSTSGPALVLFDSRPTGSSTYRYDARSQQFIFNWDTTATNKANCYRVRLTLNDGSPARVTIVRFR